jgi:hypothetical protein
MEEEPRPAKLKPFVGFFFDAGRQHRGVKSARVSENNVHVTHIKPPSRPERKVKTKFQ